VDQVSFLQMFSAKDLASVCEEPLEALGGGTPAEQQAALPALLLAETLGPAQLQLLLDLFAGSRESRRLVAAAIALLRANANHHKTSLAKHLAHSYMWRFLHSILKLNK